MFNFCEDESVNQADRQRVIKRLTTAAARLSPWQPYCLWINRGRARSFVAGRGLAARRLIGYGLQITGGAFFIHRLILPMHQTWTL